MSGSRTLRDYLLLSWVLPLTLALAGSAILSLGLSYGDYLNHRENVRERLQSKAALIARRLAAELLLKSNGRVLAVTERLKAENKLVNLQLSTNSRAEVIRDGEIAVTEPIPGFAPNTFVTLSAQSSPFTGFLNFRNFFFALVPILGLVLSGFLIQRRLINRYVVQPVQALTQISTGDLSQNPDWPIEIQAISADLSKAFSNREQAVFGQVARGIIHDLRTYLNSIHTAHQLVSENPHGSEKRSNLLEKLSTACERNLPKLQDLIKTSLDTSREISVQANSHDLTRTLESSIVNVEALAITKGVVLSANLSRIHRAHDATQLDRVFTNLLKNAIEASEESKVARRVSITAQLKDKHVEVLIEDTGSGIRNPDSLFRPLKTTKPHGYGLGLFISKRIVEAHLGSISVSRSRRLGGAEFSVTLPIQEAKA